MKKPALMLSALFVLVLSSANADPIAHFEGKTVESLDDAVTTLIAYNKRLSNRVAQENLSETDLAAIHELTYTLENALQKVEREVADLIVTLEEIHLASEAFDADKVKLQADRYLATSNTLFGQSAE